MPRPSLTVEEAIQDWWATRPHRSDLELLRTFAALTKQYGTHLPGEERFKMHCALPKEVRKRSGANIVLTAPTDIGREEALKLCEQPLDDSHYSLLFGVHPPRPRDGVVREYGGMVVTPAREPLCILLKNVLPKSLLDEVRPIVRKAATQRKVAGGNRGVAAGTGMVARRNNNGEVSNIKGAATLEDLSDKDYARLRSATDGTFGFNARGVRGGQMYPCRITRYSGTLPVEWALMGVLAKQVADAFKQSWVGSRWEAQFAKAKNTAPTWMIKSGEGITPFTTITCNRSWRTAAHVDKGDLKEGFGVMCCLGDFGGCDLVFPRYRCAVRYREGDVLLANVHEVHGNTPLLNPDGSVPEVGREPERLVCVFYYQEKMEQCAITHDEETEWINNYERGQSSKKKAKKKAKAAKA